MQLGEVCGANPYGLQLPETGLWSIYLIGIAVGYGMRHRLYGSLGPDGARMLLPAAASSS